MYVEYNSRDQKGEPGLLALCEVQGMDGMPGIARFPWLAAPMRSHAQENDMQNSPPATPAALCEVQGAGQMLGNRRRSAREHALRPQDRVHDRRALLYAQENDGQNSSPATQPALCEVHARQSP